MNVANEDVIERIFREESGRAVATLIRLFGSIDVAEEAVQDAFAIAIERWRISGIPPNPVGWIITTARNKSLDRLRRESTRLGRETDATLLSTHEPKEVETMQDDRLRLIFTCCHPALSTEAQVALTLRLVAGLRTPEIARAFLVPEPTMAQRLTRAKSKITAAKIPYRIPEMSELPARLQPVLAVIYLVFNESYVASSGNDLTRPDLSAEALRLARLIVELMPDEPEAVGLLALLLLTEARRSAREMQVGSLVVLSEQDRTRWNTAMIDEGLDLVRRCLRRNMPGQYQIQAAINAVHDSAPTASDTDWSQILHLYDQLLVYVPTPVVALNRAVAVAELTGPQSALDIVDQLQLKNYYLFHAVRGEFLSRLQRTHEARIAYEAALALTDNVVERAFLENKITICSRGKNSGKQTTTG